MNVSVVMNKNRRTNDPVCEVILKIIQFFIYYKCRILKKQEINEPIALVSYACYFAILILCNSTIDQNPTAASIIVPLNLPPERISAV